MNRLCLCRVATALLMVMPASAGLAASHPHPERPAEPLLASPVPAQAEKDRLPMPLVSRGQMLYENHCTSCHESVLFIRERRDVKTLPALGEEVRRWVRETKLPWGNEEIAEVVGYLNRSFYRFPWP